MESTIAGIEDKLGLAVAENQKRFFAIKLLERDSKISEVLKSAQNVDAEIKALEENTMMIQRVSSQTRDISTYLQSSAHA